MIIVLQLSGFYFRRKASGSNTSSFGFYQKEYFKRVVQGLYKGFS